jgi:hypothetical protein
MSPLQSIWYVKQMVRIDPLAFKMLKKSFGRAIKMKAGTKL